MFYNDDMPSTSPARKTALERKTRPSAPPLDYAEALLFRFKLAGLPEPQREFIFHRKRKWRFDLAWPELMIAVEIEGGVWTGGRHVRGEGYESDCEKYNEAQLAGWMVLRFTPGMMKHEKAGDFIEKAIRRAIGGEI